MTGKSSGRSTPPPRKTRRRWHTAPVITHGPEALEGAQVLDEVADGVGVLLWQSLRDVLLWASSVPAEHEELFARHAGRLRQAITASAGVPKEVEAPLAVLNALVADAAGFDATRIGVACEQLARWAADQGWAGTELEFSQARALACPDSAPATLQVARLAQRRWQHARAETWFRRTVTVARQTGDWASYAQGLLGLGRLYRERGNRRAAERFLVRALRAATRRGLTQIRVEVLRGLLHLTLDYKDLERAEAYLEAALEATGSEHAGLPRLAYDAARLRLAQGAPAPALVLLERLLPRCEQPGSRLRLLGDLARAAGETGRRERFAAAWTEAWALVPQARTTVEATTVLLELARGATALAEYERALEAAMLGRDLARKTGNRRLRTAADTLARSLRARMKAAEARRAPPAPRTADASEAEDRLVDQLAHSLCTHAGHGC